MTYKRTHRFFLNGTLERKMSWCGWRLVDLVKSDWRLYRTGWTATTNRRSLSNTWSHFFATIFQQTCFISKKMRPFTLESQQKHGSTRLRFQLLPGQRSRLTSIRSKTSGEYLSLPSTTTGSRFRRLQNWKLQLKRHE